MNLIHKTAVIALSGFLAVSAFSMPVIAEEETSITYTGGGETYTKISHPSKDVKTTDGIVDYMGNGVVALPSDGGNNEGDRGQNYSWAALAYGDYLYVGTCYSAMGNTLSLMSGVLGDTFDQETMEATLNVMFNGDFYTSQEDGVDSRGILVKVNTKTGEMKLLMSESYNKIAPLFRNGIIYHDKLYFCGSVRANGSTGLPSVYEIDPTTDEFKAVYVGLNNMRDYGVSYKLGISTGIRGMAVYNDQLVISNVYYDSTTGNEGANILISSDPSSGFKEIANSDDLFGYPAYHYEDSIYGGSIWDMASYNGKLYVSICTGTPDNAPDDNSMQSFAIVRGEENEDGSFTWTPIVGDTNDGARYTFGIDPERTRSGAANFIVYKDYLYIGEYNDEEIALERILFNQDEEVDPESNVMSGLDFSFVNANLEQSVNLYRMNQNEDIELIVGDATEMFPNGGSSGLGSGFGHNENQYIWRMQVYNGKLYVGTFDTSSLLEPVGQFSNGDILRRTPEEWEKQIQYIITLLEKLYGDSDTTENQIEMIDDTVEENTDSQELYDFVSELANVEYALADDTTDAVNTLSLDDDSSTETVTHDISYYEDFIRTYEGLFDQYETLKNDYDISDELKSAIEELLDQDALKRLKSVVECLAYMAKAERGFDLYVSEDGINFTTVTTNGFGDPYNHGLRVFAETTQGLFIGTANPFYGTQLWMTNSNKTVVEKPTVKEGLVYTGEEQYGLEENEAYELTNASATNAGTYTATVKLKDGYIWSDATSDDLTLTWSIDKATQQAPKTLETKDGGSIVNTTENMEYSVSGKEDWKVCTDKETAVEAGSYVVRYKEDENHYASDVTTVIVSKKKEEDPKPTTTPTPTEKPTNTTTPTQQKKTEQKQTSKTIDTSDQSHVTMWIGTAGIALIAGVTLLIFRKKKG